MNGWPKFSTLALSLNDFLWVVAIDVRSPTAQGVENAQSDKG